jgi:hypothetical protein
MKEDTEGAKSKSQKRKNKKLTADLYTTKRHHQPATAKATSRRLKSKLFQPHSILHSLSLRV